MSSAASSWTRRLGLPGRGAHLSMRWNSVALMLAVLSASATGQLTWIVAAHVAPAREVGLASGAIAAMILCGQIGLMGLGSAVIALLPEYGERASELLVTTICAAAVTGLVLAGLFLTVASSELHELSVIASNPVYAITFLGMGALWTVFLLLEPTSTALRRGDQVLIRNTLAGGLRLAVLLACAVVTGAATSLAIFAAWVISIVAGSALGHAQLARSMPSGRLHLSGSLPMLRRALRIGLPNYALDLAFMAPGLLLPILVTELLSPAQNAYWYIAWALAGLAFLGPHYVAMALFAEVAHHPNALPESTRQAVRAALLLGVAAAVFLTVGVQWILPVVGSAYATEGAAPLRILAWAVVPLAFLETYMAVCRLRRRVLEATLVCAAIGGVAVVGAAGLGPRIGLVGVAAAWLASQTLGGLFALWRLPRAVAEYRYA